MSITKRRKEIQEFLQKFLSKVQTKYPVIFEDQHEPRPNSPHFTFKLGTNFQRIGNDDITYYDKTTGKQMKRDHREFTVSIKAAGFPIDGSIRNFVSAVDLLSEIQSAIEIPTYRQEFSKAGIGIVDAQQIVDTTDLEDNMFIPRAVWDVRMNTTIETEIFTGIIEHVIISGKVDEREIPQITVPKP